MARRLCQDAIDSLSTFDQAADPLRQLADYIVERSH
jgi:geranylgeranyl pyrophosphate synthase